ncbi:hypothetical protein [Oryza sativa Japonica Group]|uniref:Uncharacterized protein n=1 Tax=Oryza sativa subsp. japonica TaxID=39947 RepID=Q5VRZ1_ORYSJ|nr:hypothetical protein [Oryza sativa Japonica Group]
MAFPGGADPCGDGITASIHRLFLSSRLPMRDTSIVGIDGADNRTLQHVWSSGDGAESVIPLIQQAGTLILVSLSGACLA